MHYSSCPSCLGYGKVKGKLSKNTLYHYQKACEEFSLHGKGDYPVKPAKPEIVCPNCKGRGIVESDESPVADSEKFPHVAIIGAGIGGVTLAVACYHRGIPFTLFERDADFDARSQGYGLTLQQASTAMSALGINTMEDGIVSTKHVVHTPDGTIVGEWGFRNIAHMLDDSKKRKTNIHIARQSLRRAIFNQLPDTAAVKWGYQLTNYENLEDGTVEVTFKVGEARVKEKCDLVVGADGIRSRIRNLMISEEKSPMRYLDCMVVLGICPMDQIKDVESALLDGKTVFQTANGNDRIYMMPFDSESIMWQLSFPISEEEAIQLSQEGAIRLKEEAIARTPWHKPIPQIVKSTPQHLISGYPVYDRELLKAEYFEKAGSVTLLGDAAHPMSPFKGQGANQAILDALVLAKRISKVCHSNDWKTLGLRESVLEIFEEEMIARSAIKVKGSAAAATVLHTKDVLLEGNKTRGSFAKGE